MKPKYSGHSGGFQKSPMEISNLIKTPPTHSLSAAGAFGTMVVVHGLDYESPPLPLWRLTRGVGRSVIRTRRNKITHISATRKHDRRGAQTKCRKLQIAPHNTPRVPAHVLYVCARRQCTWSCSSINLGVIRRPSLWHEPRPEQKSCVWRCGARYSA